MTDKDKHLLSIGAGFLFYFCHAMKTVRHILALLLAACQFPIAMAQQPFDAANPELGLAGDVGYMEQETSAIWTVNIATGKRRRTASAQVKRTQSIETWCFDTDGKLVAYCRYTPRNANLATIELGADGSSPVIVGDSIDMTVPAVRIEFSYPGNGICVSKRWECSLGKETFVGTDTVAVGAGTVFTDRKESGNDSVRYTCNRRGHVTRIERDWDENTMSVTIYDDYKYDVYGNWTRRNTYSLQPDGRRRLTGCSTRTYRYR